MKMDINSICERYLTELENKCINSFAFKNSRIFPKCVDSIQEFFYNFDTTKKELELLSTPNPDYINGQVYFGENYYDLLSDKFYLFDNALLMKYNVRLYFTLYCGIKYNLVEMSDLYTYFREFNNIHEFLKRDYIKFNFRNKEYSLSSRYNKYIKPNNFNTILSFCDQYKLPDPIPTILYLDEIESISEYSLNHTFEFIKIEVLTSSIPIHDVFKKPLNIVFKECLK